MINKAALDLIKEFEGFRAHAYRDPVGILTIGYGTTAAAGVGITPKIGMTITEAKATAYLDAAVTKFAHHVTAALKRPATPVQFGAMVSLAYNIGPEAFAKSSICRKFNAGDMQGAADAFLLWNKAGGKVLNGLVRRRQAERALFLSKPASLPTPKQGIKPASSATKIGKPADLRPVSQKTPTAAIGAVIVAIIAAVLKWLGVW